MYNNRCAGLPVGCRKLQPEALRQLKVELNGGRLVVPSQGVGQREVYLGSIEGTVSLQNVPCNSGERPARRWQIRAHTGTHPYMHMPALVYAY